MPSLPPEIGRFVAADKELLTRPTWDEQSDSRYYVFTAPLRVEGITIGGLELRAKVSKQFVDRAALMQLEFALSGRERVPLWRCQWRPFETHTNRNWGPPGYELSCFDRASHHHPFSENYVTEKNCMREGSLPAALPIDPDPTTLSGFIAFCGTSFRITNMRLVAVPERSVDMFWVPND